jgi:type I restriction enzyme S subunit
MAIAEKLITEHIDVWTSAIKKKSSAGRGGGKKQELYGIKRLRGLIMDLAIRGLLVPQDPSDEPVVVRGDIDLFKDESGTEVPFHIPSNWKWKQLDQLTTINGGFAFKSRDYTEEGTRVVRISDFDEHGFKNDKIVRHSFSPEIDKFSLRDGDILMAMTGGTVGKSLLVRTLPEPMIVNQRVATIRAGAKTEARYINILIQSELTQKVIHKAKNSTNDNISMRDIKGFYLPLPPLAEQHRIVAKVDELMALCDQLELRQEDSLQTHQTLVKTLLGALTSASDPGQFSSAWKMIESNFDTLFTTERSIDELKQTILQLAVMGKLVPQDPNDEPASELLKKIAAEKSQLIDAGKIRKTKKLPTIGEDEIPYRLPEAWSWNRLNEIISILGDGIHGTPEYDPNGQYYFINGNNLSDGKIEIKPETKKVSEQEYKLHKKPLDETTVLVSINGTIGRVAFYCNEKVMLGKSACYFNLLGSISLNYSKIVIQTAYFLEYAFRNATGSTIKNVSLKTMRELPFPLPPLAEQHRIVAKVDELMALCDRLKAGLQTAQTTQLQLADTLVESAIH